MIEATQAAIQCGNRSAFVASGSDHLVPANFWSRGRAVVDRARNGDLEFLAQQNLAAARPIPDVPPDN